MQRIQAPRSSSRAPPPQVNNCSAVKTTVAPSGLGSSLALSETHTGAPAILVDEFDTCAFERSPNYLNGRPTRVSYPCLKLTHGNDPNASMVCQVLLAPIQEATCGSALR